MDFGHWERLVQLIDDAAGAHDLPGGVRATRKAGVLQLRRLSADARLTSHV